MSNIRRELTKILLQKRTYVGWAFLFVIPFLVTIAVRFSNGPRGGGGGPAADTGEQLIRLLKGNGIYMSVVSILVLASFLLPLLASMVGANTVAGEAENHTLRTVLMQPVRRGALLLSKWFVANVYMAIGLVLVLAASLIAGGAFFGLHPMQLLSGGVTLSVSKSLGTIALSYLYILLGMAAVVSLAVMFSTLTDSSLTAIGVALVLVIVMLVLGGFSVFNFIKPYFFTSHFDAWQNLLQRPIVYGPIWKGLAAFAAWIAATTGFAYLNFRRKDVLS
jgi:ABC-2 type transport system permease protein